VTLRKARPGNGLRAACDVPRRDQVASVGGYRIDPAGCDLPPEGQHDSQAQVSAAAATWPG
jgi:hypothetical protein